MKTRPMIIAALAAMLAAAGCGFDPSTMKVPGTRVGGETYSVRIEFANVLNLPPGAKVYVNGVLAGNLDRLDLSDSTNTAKGFAVATVDIAESVRLPATATAELRQSTPLGDVQIALTSKPGDNGPALTPGATIPLRQTRPALAVEETFAGMATAMGNGAMLDIQDIVRKLNTALPADPADTARMFGVLGNDLTDLAGNIADVDAFLNGLDGTVAQVIADDAELQKLLRDHDVQHVTDVVSAVANVLFIMAGLAPIANNALWLAPLLSALDDTAKGLVPLLFTTRPLDLNAPSNLSKLVSFIQDKVIPFTASGPKVNILGITTRDAEERPAQDRVQQIIDSLRMIGAVR